MVEFSVDAYAHRKQVGVKQLYNQVPQMAWVKFSSSCSWNQLGTRCQRENQLADWGLAALSDPQLSNPARMRKKCCYGQRNFGSICSSLSPSPTHLSHITDINPFTTLLRRKCERYIFIMFIHSLKFVIMFLLTSVCIWVYNNNKKKRGKQMRR